VADILGILIFFNRRLKFCSLIGEEKQVAAKNGDYQNGHTSQKGIP
jgi:hypothetical protein